MSREKTKIFQLTFDEFQVVEPGVVVHRVGGDLLLVLELPLLDDDVLDADALAELLLVRRVVLVKVGARILRKPIQGQPVDGSSPVVLLESNNDEGQHERHCKGQRQDFRHILRRLQTLLFSFKSSQDIWCLRINDTACI